MPIWRAVFTTDSSASPAPLARISHTNHVLVFLLSHSFSVRSSSPHAVAEMHTALVWVPSSPVVMFSRPTRLSTRRSVSRTAVASSGLYLVDCRADQKALCRSMRLCQPLYCQIVMAAASRAFLPCKRSVLLHNGFDKLVSTCDTKPKHFCAHLFPLPCCLPLSFVTVLTFRIRPTHGVLDVPRLSTCAASSSAAAARGDAAQAASE